MARLGGAAGWKVTHEAQMMSMGRGWPAQNQDHQESLWCLYENICKKGQKTVGSREE